MSNKTERQLGKQRVIDDFLAIIEDWNYSTAESKIQEVANSVSEEDISDIMLSDEMLRIIPSMGYHKWYLNKAFAIFLGRSPSLGDHIIKEGISDCLALICLQNGFYSDISVINFAALNDSIPDTQLYAAHTCDFKTLKKLTSHKSNKVRSVVFTRLGPVEALDDMLIDKKASVRELGVSYAPFGYSKLSLMTKELARGVFRELVSKISLSDIPMMLANRNLKCSWQQKKLEERMSRGY